MRFMKDDGNLIITNKENLILLSKHFYSICNWEIEVDWDYINRIPYFEILYEIGRPMTAEELDEVIKKLQWHKALGRNGVLLNILKALDENHYMHLLKFIRY